MITARRAVGGLARRVGGRPPVLLRADPRARIQVGRRTLAVTSRELDDAEVERFWPRRVQLWSAYATLAERGGARAVFALEPMPGAA